MSSVKLMNMENFVSFIERKYNEKYNSCLESLKDRFAQVFSILKKIMESIIELNEELKSEMNIYGTYKPLIDNIIRLLDIMIGDYPECIDLEFVELFFTSIQERIQIFWAHFHQLAHITHSNKDKLSLIVKIVKTIENLGNILPITIIESRNRTKLSYPLLKHIKDCKNVIKQPIKKFKQEIHLLSNNKSYEEYENVYEEVRSRSKGPMKIKIDFIENMIDLVKEGSQYQYELSKMIKPYSSMVNIYKNKKQLQTKILEPNDHAKLLKYVNMLARPDFVNSCLLSLDFKELIYILKLIELQTELVSEYKKTLNKGIEDYNPINLTEFELILEKYKQVMANIVIFQDEAQRNFESMRFNKETTSQIFKDIKRVVDKYKEYQNGIFYYQELLEFFTKIRHLASKIAFNEFGERIELVCEYNL